MVEVVKAKHLGIELDAGTRGVKKYKYSLMAREVPVFCGLIKQQAPRRAVEIGTWWGMGAETILEMSPGCDVVTIDYKDQKVTRDPALGPPDPRINYVIEDSRTVRLPRDWYGTTDLVFIDGDHRRNGVVNDTRLALSLVADDGLIIWHDVMELGSDSERAKGLQSKHKYYVSEYLHNVFPLTIKRVEGTALGFYRPNG
jgi:predicted O-methyltransferase YrrM